MKFFEITGDLFDMPEEYYFAHCISGDYALGAGIAKTFATKMNMKYELFKNFPIPLGTGSANVGKALLIGKVFNLVTKSRCFQKPTYDTIYETLIDMKKQCVEKEIKYLAMPLIGCGLDRCDWDKVRNLIKKVFEDTDIEIVICKL